MNTNRFFMGSIAGGLALYAIGLLLWGVLFGQFFADNAGTATGVDRETPIVWAVLTGNLAMGALITLAINTQSDSANIATGFKTGAGGSSGKGGGGK